ncbi:MAG: MBL fold metallo-hydrolase [Candidatus Portnoybacteria bacterium]|nr:MBL fold metallo-hydrolase [Candidatus Portnoybacteria bacterium]
MAKLKFLGGAGTVSGSCYVLEAAGKKIMIDCGSFQGPPELERKNSEPFDFETDQIDYLLLTHCHLDHIGRLPILVKQGFDGKIYATPPTIDFVELMLEDSRRVLEAKARKDASLIFYHEPDVRRIMALFESATYHQKVQLSENIYFEFFEAGHILGAVIIRIVFDEGSGERTIVFSGDLGQDKNCILRSPETIDRADYVLIESAYGDRLHETQRETKDQVEDAIEETISRGGVLMIPTFAIERAQQLLSHLNELVENKRIGSLKIFIDSPLAIKATQIYEKYMEFFNKETCALIKSGDDIFKFNNLEFTPTIKDSKRINDSPPPKIIIAGSGMSEGGRIIHHEARYLPDSKNTLLFVSYQAEGTLGRKILDGEKEVEILDQKIKVRAQIKSISGYSAHADKKELISWLGAIRKPIKMVFVVQGEKVPAETLAQTVRDEMGVDAKVPELGQEVELQ